MNNLDESYQSVLIFWFEEIPQEMWWKKDLEFDRNIKKRFLELHQKVAQGEAFSWRQTPEGCLAEVIVLDQFSRNMFRGHADSFRYDGLALVMAQNAIEKGFDQKIEESKRSFLYMPFMHSESAVIHEQAVKLFEKLGSMDFELKHKAIIDRFGRYPHRNEILGRESTPEELEFLKGPNSSF